ncbi:MAG: ABC transporter substrate-binding protein [Paraclostridium sp.]|uniref:ABC transporter substrate-binding protein n=1 Tax=Paraclostridium sp. TaxID=2023273 RepID=UPI003F2DB773
MKFRKRLLKMSVVSSMIIVSLVGCSNNSVKSTEKVVKGDAFKVLENKNARAAIALALDKQLMCESILNNGSTPVNYLVAEDLAFDSQGKDYREFAGNMGYEHNDEEANKAWDKAKEELGFDIVELDFLTGEGDNSKRQAEFIQAELQSSLPGLTVNIKQQPMKQRFESEEKGDYHFTYSNWNPDYSDPLTFLETMQTGIMYGLTSGYSNLEYDKLVNEGKNSTDQVKSWENYAKAEKIMLDDVFLIPLSQTASAYLEKDYVKGRVLYPYGTPAGYNWVELGEGRTSLNLSSTADIPTLDVSKAGDTVSSEVLTNVMEGLTRVDKDGKVIPGMAENWQKSEDGKTWTFNIRKDAKWSNGDKVTAKDFEFSWKRTLNPETASGYAFIMYDIVGAKEYNLGEKSNPDELGIKAIDDYTLEVNLVRPVHYFDSLMFFKTFFPQNQKVVEKFGSEYGTSKDAMVYNGPFTMTEWKFEDVYIMSKNTNYWAKDTVKIENVNTKIVKDSNAALNLYETGQIDVVGLTSENVDRYKDSPEFKTSKKAGTTFLQINGGNH